MSKTFAMAASLSAYRVIAVLPLLLSHKFTGTKTWIRWMRLIPITVTGV